MESAGLETAKLLGTANGQLILAIMLVFAVGVAVWLGRALFTEMKACHAQMVDMMVKKIESDNKMADALGGLERVIETTLRARP